MNSRHFFNNYSKFLDLDWEPYQEQYQPILDSLSKILSNYEKIEGNIFGWSQTPLEVYPVREFRNKRRNLALFSMSKENILEVGFNAGHSALLILSSNPNVKYTAIDIMQHDYTIECYDCLKTIFKDRIELIKGDATVKLPELLANNSEYDGYIIDGNHTFGFAYNDVYNIINYAKNGSVICVDDTDLPRIQILLNYFMLKGLIIQIQDDVGFIKSASHTFFRILK